MEKSRTPVEIEAEISHLRKIMDEKKNEVVRANVTKEHFLKQIDETKKILEEYGIKDLDNPEREIEQMGLDIEKGLQEITDIVESWDAADE